MPELPEVEVSRLGITPHLKGQKVKAIHVRQPKLRWMVPDSLQSLVGEEIVDITRRAKYLMIETKAGSAVVHLGMSGSLRILDAMMEPGKHDHVDLVLKNGKVLRYNDPRRFGSWLHAEPGEQHEVLSHLGPEPLTEEFSLEYFVDKAKRKKTVVKQFIMDNKVVVGVGNIYANESLFMSRIHPQTPANQLTDDELALLHKNIIAVLETAIKQGGTTLKDFNQVDGKPGYFAQVLQVYGRTGEQCQACESEIEEVKIGQRNTFYCPECQPLERS
ncbi:Formamidopyrimidine-DNA glycosylase [Vibrio nigripulchritudo SO65]|uniref:bifunctional DNA-formamidopyrimidine glycosylase/DNA-(apurinic or apyrimidinic site) lyase n=1 Tax=Vibrio nigripulchritudo TaxID=28173 RepID=UPI0003B1CC65|nr:bifunctional DNA-formamidopyrimidine glycosylase/DNA-(apurinic or apyrimidinic site) lyase [Vibrio nigripulchritudo]CCN37755.1 Formamidopyrimidine-DNA glycosylase [Vibrio nigripulchritudo AM115]CCN39961.1 Formamidopyrimidine-DNA glycosylase [Vibrio nigripulchritudo FTn2]CCN64789.1 Formamidopyrimidine-DNA glycosylase [Vibrio nigripulchritudo POn4]CCN78225.1 Formamidopyrimidine-DNA glycosylase [Vibrio nigripulchritudo SO65]